MCKEEPTPSALRDLLGVSLFEVWQGFRSAIEAAYEMEQIGGPGGKNWRYEYKYRRGGKTLCCLYARENCFGFLVIFGQAERAAFEEMRGALPARLCRQYDEATTYRDGKWVLFAPTDLRDLDANMKILALKRKPNRKRPLPG